MHLAASWKVCDTTQLMAVFNTTAATSCEDKINKISIWLVILAYFIIEIKRLVLVKYLACIITKTDFRTKKKKKVEGEARRRRYLF